VCLSCVIHSICIRSFNFNHKNSNSTQIRECHSLAHYTILQFNLIAGSIQKLGTTSSMNVAMSPSGSLTLDLALGESFREQKAEKRRGDEMREVEGRLCRIKLN
jgi:hypothetical protein